MNATEYESRSAQDARDRGYGTESYWSYLDRAARESRDHYLRLGDPERAELMMSRTLVEALRGNDGE